MAESSRLSSGVGLGRIRAYKTSKKEGPQLQADAAAEEEEGKGHGGITRWRSGGRPNKGWDLQCSERSGPISTILRDWAGCGRVVGATGRKREQVATDASRTPSIIGSRFDRTTTTIEIDAHSQPRVWHSLNPPSRGRHNPAIRRSSSLSATLTPTTLIGVGSPLRNPLHFWSPPRSNGRSGLRAGTPQQLLAPRGRK